MLRGMWWLLACGLLAPTTAFVMSYVRMVLTMMLLIGILGCQGTQGITPRSYGRDTCQQRLSRAGMEQDRAHYYCIARGR